MFSLVLEHISVLAWAAVLRSDSVRHLHLTSYILHLQVSVSTLMPARLKSIVLEEVGLTYHSMLQTSPKFTCSDDKEKDLRKFRAVGIILVVWHRLDSLIYAGVSPNT